MQFIKTTFEGFFYKLNVIIEGPRYKLWRHQNCRNGTTAPEGVDDCFRVPSEGVTRSSNRKARTATRSRRLHEMTRLVSVSWSDSFANCHNLSPRVNVVAITTIIRRGGGVWDGSGAPSSSAVIVPSTTVQQRGPPTTPPVGRRASTARTLINLMRFANDLDRLINGDGKWDWGAQRDRQKGTVSRDRQGKDEDRWRRSCLLAD